MAKFNLETAQSPPLAEASRHALPEALRQGAPVGPRLVGGTSFTGKSALDLAQIQILAQACLQGLDAARQVVFGWQRQGQSLEDIYMQGITPCARLLGDWWCADRLDFAMTTIASAHLQQLLHDFSSEFLQEALQSFGCEVRAVADGFAPVPLLALLKHPLAVALCAALAVSALPVFAQSTGTAPAACCGLGGS